MGPVVGEVVGAPVTLASVGFAVTRIVGELLGAWLGEALGDWLGEALGALVGASVVFVGEIVGLEVGANV